MVDLFQEVPVTQHKEFTLAVWDYKYYAAILQRGEYYEVITQVNGQTPTITEFDTRLNECETFFKGFIDTALKTM